MAYNKKLEFFVILNLFICIIPFLFIFSMLFGLIIFSVFFLFPLLGEECSLCGKKVRGIRSIKYLFNYFFRNKTNPIICSFCEAKNRNI